jgi:molybdopterin converting factor small subunit
MMTIKAFGLVAEKINTAELQTDDFPDVQALLQWLFEAYPQLQSVKFSVAVNKQLAHAQSTLQNGSEIALLPPFSGG